MYLSSMLLADHLLLQVHRSVVGQEGADIHDEESADQGNDIES